MKSGQNLMFMEILEEQAWGEEGRGMEERDGVGFGEGEGGW